jgi:hypothetical protein
MFISTFGNWGWNFQLRRTKTRLFCRNALLLFFFGAPAHLQSFNMQIGCAFSFPTHRSSLLNVAISWILSESIPQAISCSKVSKADHLKRLLVCCGLILLLFPLRIWLLKRLFMILDCRKGEFTPSGCEWGTDKFPEAFRRFENDVDLSKFESYRR